MAEAELDAEQEEAAGKGGKKGLILMIVVVLVAVAAGVGGTLYFVGGGDSAEVAEADTTEAATPAIYHEMRPSFIVNYNTDTKPRYLQAEVSVMARKPALIEALVDHTPLIRSLILKELSDASFEEIRTHEGKEALRDSLRIALDAVIAAETEESGIESVLFTNFVLQ